MRHDLVVLSPGISRRRKELDQARADGRLVGEVELASWFLSCPLVGVTGTNGKSTTTSLLAFGFEAAGRRAFAGGNLGRPLSTLVSSGEAVDVAVVELSSYQLESVVRLSLVASTWLNLAPDHLERYGDVDTYALAKRRIAERTRREGTFVANADDRHVAMAAEVTTADVRWFGRSSAGPVAEAGTRISEDGRGLRTAAGVEELYGLEGRALIGPHNYENAAAAIEVWRSQRVPPEVVSQAIHDFPGLPHRLELVATTCGKRWINDSKATNVSAARVALRAVRGRKVLIVGGRRKMEPLDALVEAAVAHDVCLVLSIGESALEFSHAFHSILPVEAMGTLDAAVERSKEIESDVVLLSPACASFDQFRDFEHRGDHFRALLRGNT
ncbi:MAG: UDP-N-acetylmuramoyl-L-alanine--D-glutamate ligase [Myxococcales bacterium]|nr:UDP-N-acetylmuramoyl-L-alanine--D-glutamate ligase [Myxococcales bacterium]